jgi:hypothetical protein
MLVEPVERSFMEKGMEDSATEHGLLPILFYPESGCNQIL